MFEAVKSTKQTSIHRNLMPLKLILKAVDFGEVKLPFATRTFFCTHSTFKTTLKEIGLKNLRREICYPTLTALNFI